MNKSRLETVLWTVLAFVLLVTLVGVLSLRYTKANIGYLPVNAIPQDSDLYNAVAIEQDLVKLKKFIDDYVKIDINGADGVIEIQRIIGNLVDEAGTYYGNETGIHLLKKGIEGVPLACGSMSDILHASLSAYGYKSRIIQLYASNFSTTDTHVLIEVYLENRWVLFDPTFNVTYELEGRRVGVSEVQNSLRVKGPDSIKPFFYGERSYPADIKNYYMDWRPLFNNAHVMDRRGDLWRKIPPMKYLYGPHIYYFGEELDALSQSQNGIYFIFYFILPVISFILVVLTLFFLFLKKRF